MQKNIYGFLFLNNNKYAFKRRVRDFFNYSILSLYTLYFSIFVSIFYLLQKFTAFPFSSDWRFLIIGAAFALAAISERDRLLRLPIAFFLLGVSVLWTCVHTIEIYGAHLGMATTARFANVMILAPLASLIIATRKNLNAIFIMYITLFSIAFISLLYQHFGGSLPTLVGNYIAIRADLIRYMTIVGEPNVGGMIAVVCFIIGMTLPRSFGVSVVLSALAICFVIMSVSKAALLGMGIAFSILILLGSAKGRAEILLRGLLAFLVAFALLQLTGANAYVVASFESVSGNIKGEPSVVSDFANRQSGYWALLESKGSGFAIGLSVVFGASFGVAGSSALEILGAGADVILPHNSYLEMLITGGIVMIAPMIYLMIGAFRCLASEMQKDDNPQARCAFVCLVLLACWMLIYPVIYEPATGALLWSLIGYGNRVPAARS